MANPRIYGTGLIALDLVVSDSCPSPRLWAGGTCGNVLTILGYLGWEAFPIARLRRDTAADYARADMERWGVRLDFLHLEPATDTPIILQRISLDASGVPFHRFSWSCPHCGGRFPRYSAVPQGTIQNMINDVSKPKVFFLDRVSRGALALAKACAEEGAVIVFEPSGVGDPDQFNEALRMAHILKYSHERMRAHIDGIDFDGDSGGSRPLIEIETLGRGGLSYRCRLDSYTTSGWQSIGAFKASGLKDTCGAGDWCTAGILSRIAGEGLPGLRNCGESDVVEALSWGQALAAWNCGFEGARGGMDAYSCDQLTDQIRSILEHETVEARAPDAVPQQAVEVLHGICSTCTSPQLG